MVMSNCDSKYPFQLHTSISLIALSLAIPARNGPLLITEAELAHLQIRADRYRHGLNPKHPRNVIPSISLDAPDPTVAAYHRLTSSRQSLPTYLRPRSRPKRIVMRSQLISRASGFVASWCLNWYRETGYLTCLMVAASVQLRYQHSTTD